MLFDLTQLRPRLPSDHWSIGTVFSGGKQWEIKLYQFYEIIGLGLNLRLNGQAPSI